MERCLFCQAELPLGERLCRHCGRRQPSGPLSNPSESTDGSQSRRCANCGAALRAGVRFCTNCGHSTSDEQDLAPVEPAGKAQTISSSTFTDHESAQGDAPIMPVTLTNPQVDASSALDPLVSSQSSRSSMFDVSAAPQVDTSNASSAPAGPQTGASGVQSAPSRAQGSQPAGLKAEPTRAKLLGTMRAKILTAVLVAAVVVTGGAAAVVVAKVNSPPAASNQATYPPSRTANTLTPSTPTPTPSPTPSPAPSPTPSPISSGFQFYSCHNGQVFQQGVFTTCVGLYLEPPPAYVWVVLKDVSGLFHIRSGAPVRWTIQGPNVWAWQGFFTPELNDIELDIVLVTSDGNAMFQQKGASGDEVGFSPLPDGSTVFGSISIQVQ